MWVLSVRAGRTHGRRLSGETARSRTHGTRLAVDLPGITPFENGCPRHHTRLFGGDGPIGVLVGELFIPRQLSGQFAAALADWAEESIGEIVVLSGVPIAHGPEDHRAFYVATDDYRERRLTDTEIPPVGGGFLDGVSAALIQEGLASPLRVGIVATPAHARNPDVEAALRLLSAVSEAYDLDVATEPLESFAAEVKRHYTALAAWIRASEEADRPEDRMYM